MITWLLRNIFWAIDGILRFAIHLLYELIMQIASARLFQTYIFEFMDRIYTFLAIFMVFKLSISMVNYILNPEQFTDKSKGFGKIIQSVIIVIALIIFVPTIFDWAYRLQCMVLNSGVLNSVITGSPNKVDGEQLIDSCMGTEECSVNDDLADLSSNMLTYNIMSAFVYRDSSGQGDDLIPADVSGNHASAKKGSVECSSYADTGNYEAASNCIFNYQTLTSLSNSYIFLISTACLGFVAYVFLGFTIDIAIRTVKLCFLQLMSPIPIISMLDPSSGKNGMFGKWLKECTKTYGDLFIRLGAVYFAVELIGELFESEICADNAFVKIFIVLGVLAFAKQLPQFIGNIIPGAKFDSGGLSLKKKFGSVPGLNKAAAGAIGLGGGMAANAIAGDWSKGNRLKAFGSMLAGAGSGAFRGMTSKEKNAWKAGQGAIKGAVDKRNLRQERKDLDEKFKDRMQERVNKFAGITTDDSSKIEAKRKLGQDLFTKYGKKPNGEDIRDNNGDLAKYSMNGAISQEFGQAWKMSDDAKNYRNKINEQLSIARSKFQAGEIVEWNGSTGAEAIAKLEIESNKASAAYDKASADFKELRSLAAHKAETRYYDAFTTADDRYAAEDFAKKTVTNIITTDNNAASNNSGVNQSTYGQNEQSSWDQDTSTWD